MREVQSLETKREKSVGGVIQPNIRWEMLIFVISWQDCTLFDPNQALGFGHCLGSQICGYCANVLIEGFHYCFSQVRLFLSQQELMLEQNEMFVPKRTKDFFTL